MSGSRRAGGSWGYLGKAVCERVLQAHLDASMCLPIKHDVWKTAACVGSGGSCRHPARPDPVMLLPVTSVEKVHNWPAQRGGHEEVQARCQLARARCYRYKLSSGKSLEWRCCYKL